jgi:hypothetical protein
MKPEQLAIGILSGCFLIGLALIPGLFEQLTDGIQTWIHSFSSRLPMRSRYLPAREPVPASPWLAVLGGFLIVLTLMAYFLS